MASAKTRENTEKVTGDVIYPGRVVTDDASAAGVFVGNGSLCRIRVTATTYVAFGISSIGSVSSSTSPGLELTAGTWLVAASNDYIRSSAALTRLEVL